MSPHRHLACRGTNRDAVLKFPGAGPVAPVPPAQSRTATTTEARTRQDNSIGFESAFFMTAGIIALPGVKGGGKTYHCGEEKVYHRGNG